MSTEYQLTFTDYLAIIRQRLTLMLITFGAVFGISVVVAVVIPPVYESTGTILVESQQIPVDLVAATITSFADERIEVIRQRVMTRENLMRIVDKYKLFADEGVGVTVSEKVDHMRKSIGVVLVNANVKGRGQAAIAFKVSFEHRHADVANKVANELVTLFMEENVKQRTERATETTEFLTQEADKLKVELEKTEADLAVYKQQNGSALPENQTLRVSILARTESDLKEAERDFKSAQEELRFLDLELAAAKSGQGKSGAPGGASALPQDLGSLKAEYARLKSLYTDAHPDVRSVKRKIDALEAGAEGAANGVSKDAPVSLDVARVQAKIAATQSRANSLSAQIQSLRGKLGNYERQLMQAPEVERGLVALMRDHENAQKKYEEIRAKQRSAQISENLEQENKAERFILLEPPLMPEKPIKPNRLKLIGMGLFLALASAAGLVMMLESMQQRVRGEEALAVIIRGRVLSTIPYIAIQDEADKRRTWIKRAVIIGIAVVLLTMLCIHLLYQPLDILVYKIFNRLG